MSTVPEIDDFRLMIDDLKTGSNQQSSILNLKSDLSGTGGPWRTIV